jgi:hypothetical protein
VRTLAVSVVLVALLVLDPSNASADQVVQFVDESQISFRFETTGDGIEATPNHVTVMVAVTEANDSTLRLHAIGEIARLISITPPEQPVVEGVASFSATLITDALEAGTTATGFIAAVTSDGAVARRPLSISDESTTSAPAALPTSVALDGWHWNFVPGSEWVTVPSRSIAAGTGKPTDDVIVGSVAATNGAGGDVVLRNGALTVADISGAGEYKGRADLTPGKDGGEADVVVRIKDGPFWPILALVAGLLIVWSVYRYSGVGRPGLGLELRLRRMNENAAMAHDAARRTIRRETGNDRFGAPVVYRLGGSDLLLNWMTSDALLRWGLAIDQKERDDLKPGGDSFKLIKTKVDDYASLLNAIIAVASLYRAIHGHAEKLGLADAAANSPVVTGLAELFVDEDITSTDELAQLSDRVKKNAGYATTLRDQLERLSAFAANEPDKTKALASRLLRRHGEQLDELWPEIDKIADAVGAPPTDVTFGDRILLAEAMASAEGTYLAYAVNPADLPERRLAHYRAGAHDVVAPADEVRLIELLDRSLLPGRGRGGETILVTKRPRDTGELIQLAGDLGSSNARTQVERVPYASELERELRDADKRFTRLAFAIAIIGGLSAAYFGNATFGSVADYATLVLWGTAFGAGAEAVKKVVFVATTWTP